MQDPEGSEAQDWLKLNHSEVVNRFLVPIVWNARLLLSNDVRAFSGLQHAACRSCCDLLWLVWLPFWLALCTCSLSEAGSIVMWSCSSCSLEVKSLESRLRYPIFKFCRPISSSNSGSLSIFVYIYNIYIHILSKFCEPTIPSVEMRQDDSLLGTASFQVGRSVKLDHQVGMTWNDYFSIKQIQCLTEFCHMVSMLRHLRDCWNNFSQLKTIVIWDKSSIHIPTPWYPFVSFLVKRQSFSRLVWSGQRQRKGRGHCS